jgi:hypothetical protein
MCSYFHKFILKQGWYLTKKEPYQMAKMLAVVCGQTLPPTSTHDSYFVIFISEEW